MAEYESSRKTLRNTKRDRILMILERDDYLISDEPSRLDLDFIWRGLNRTYWAATRTREVVEASLKNSLCVGVYEKASQRQVGFVRVVTDKVTFSWICDVFIDESHRKRGLGKWMMAYVVEHPDVKSTMSTLGTRDAHGLYEKFGYTRAELMKRPPAKHSAD